MLKSIQRSIKRLLCIALCASSALTALPFEAQAAADPNKVLRIAFESADSGLDMPRSNNSLYSSWVGDTIFETLLGYDYLARPVKLVPRLASALPEISADGKEMTFRLRQGVMFSPDPVFKGKPREVTAADMVYSLKRIVDPLNRSPQSSSLEGKIVGLDDLINAARKGQAFDYDKQIAGFEAVDRYTLKIRLITPYPALLYILATSPAGVVAREVIQAYGADIGSHPVGTGPYMLKEYLPRSKIVLVANPNFRGFVWDFSSTNPKDAPLIAAMKGKQMPQIGRVEISIVEEEQSRWLAFDSGQFDIDMLSKAMAATVLDGTQLKPKYAAKGFLLDTYVALEFTQTILNLRDPIIGGYSKEKIALRRAIAMGYLLDDEIRHLRYGQALRAEEVIAPGMAGHDPSYRKSYPSNPTLANKLLDKFGYKRGADGYRTLPDGKPLTLEVTGNSSTSVQADNELWKRSMDAIGLRTSFPVSNFGDNLKAATQCKLMMWRFGVSASIPDGIDILESYYGPNSLQGNVGCYQNAQYDKLFEQARLMMDSPERTKIYNQMNRHLEADTAILNHVWRIRGFVVRPYILGFRKHPIVQANWMYLDIEKH